MLGTSVEDYDDKRDTKKKVSSQSEELGEMARENQEMVHETLDAPLSPPKTENESQDDNQQKL